MGSTRREAQGLGGYLEIYKKNQNRGINQRQRPQRTLSFSKKILGVPIRVVMLQNDRKNMAFCIEMAQPLCFNMFRPFIFSASR